MPNSKSPRGENKTRPSPRSRRRLDQALVDEGLCESREKARRAILAGSVRVNQQLARKASDLVSVHDHLVLEAAERFVSRGGLKLDHALRHFQLEVAGRTAIDLGASTGGFTDCLLQAGAAKVYAVDVGSGQLAWKLRQDPRVVVLEKTNARHLTANHFPPPFSPVDIVVIDCSFISLRKILPVAAGLLRPGGADRGFDKAPVRSRQGRGRPRRGGDRRSGHSPADPAGAGGICRRHAGTPMAGSRRIAFTWTRGQ